MSNIKTINLSFDLEQVANDILTKCNLISIAIKDEALEDIRANVQEPDNPETRSIINRAVTEAFGHVKVACQRYLKVGRINDNNNLERMVKNLTTTKEYRDVQVTYNGHPVYTVNIDGVQTDIYLDGDDASNDWKKVSDGSVVFVEEFDGSYRPKMERKLVDTGNVDSIEYETVALELAIPNFNVAVTDALKSDIHLYVVDYAMSRFLQDQVADKASEYASLANERDYPNIQKDLNARERFNMRKPSWI